MDLLGIHHLTAVSAKIRDNHQFYTKTLGMRLVKRSVNQDDVSAYHLFYADAKGAPGTDLTFFDWPMAPERRGTRSIVRTNLRVNGLDALNWWSGHLRDRGVKSGDVVERDGRLTVDFEDPEGQRLSLVDDKGEGHANPWDRSSVASEHQVRGLGPIVLSVPNLAATDRVLQKVMNMRPTREYAHPENANHLVHVYEMSNGGAHAELHIAVQPDLPMMQLGAGGVHHVAFR
ncbi:MAG: VOC family protein, partial [Hyphomicrobiales bacterium]|nr:VOC family protein [Hyphomicrobiales bacterium]